MDSPEDKIFSYKGMDILNAVDNVEEQNEEEREDPLYEAMEISSESDDAASENEIAGEEPLHEGREVANVHRLVIEVDSIP